MGETIKPNECLNSTVVKYGYSTEVTRGAFRIFGSVVAGHNAVGTNNGASFLLLNQLEVLKIGDIPFAEAGDSGALVFVKSDSSHLKAVGLLEGSMGDGRYMVTPIQDIFRAIGLRDGHMFKQFPAHVGQYGVRGPGELLYRIPSGGNSRRSFDPMVVN